MDRDEGDACSYLHRPAAGDPDNEVPAWRYCIGSEIPSRPAVRKPLPVTRRSMLECTYKPQF
jgi:hypothetical protein